VREAFCCWLSQSSALPLVTFRLWKSKALVEGGEGIHCPLVTTRTVSQCSLNVTEKKQAEEGDNLLFDGHRILEV
jgi:hypothetical protein